jgi:hypothetical protein
MGIWKWSGLVVDERKDSCRGANEDNITTVIRRSCEQIMRIVDIYDHKDAQSRERESPVLKFNWQRVFRQGGTLLAGDFNSHRK